MTVYLSLALTLLSALFFTMAESVRVLAIGHRNEVLTEQAAENLLSMYTDRLWEDYGILGVDACCGGEETDLSALEGKLLSLAQANTEADPGTYLYTAEVSGVSIDAYAVLTDGGGTPFLRMMAEQGKAMLLESAAEKLQDEILPCEDGTAEDSGCMDAMNRGTEAIESAAEAAENQTKDTEAAESPPAPTAPPPAENPIDTGKNLFSEKALDFFIPPEEQVSDVQTDLSDAVSKRTLRTGSLASPPDLSAGDRILAVQGIMDLMGCYTGAADSGEGLQYELEYIIGGDDSDAVNLNSTIARILAFREAENLISLWSDPAKVAQAQELALVFAGATAIPPLIEAVKLGIIAAWSVAESVLDVRALLHGDRIPIVKTAAEWTSDIYTLAECFDVHKRAGACQTGISYADYLRILLTFEKKERLAYRTMDLIEQKLHAQENYENVRLDSHIWKASVTCSYQERPLFFTFVPEKAGEISIYRGTYTRQTSYID